jgi:hypothetical protein
MGGGWIFPKNLRASLFNDDLYRMSLISAGYILLDSTFNFDMYLLPISFHGRWLTTKCKKVNGCNLVVIKRDTRY